MKGGARRGRGKNLNSVRRGNRWRGQMLLCACGRGRVSRDGNCCVATDGRRKRSRARVLARVAAHGTRQIEKTRKRGIELVTAQSRRPPMSPRPAAQFSIKVSWNVLGSACGFPSSTLVWPSFSLL